ncbi:MAG: RluA family pseudouridine synthase [Lentisphaeraceae bacterium]|nr:RluA family pseudouridine synthase [Lentisphaeraceae bacterium]
MSSKLKRLVTSSVPETYAASTLIDYLSSRYAYQDRQRWIELVVAGDIQVNKQHESADFILTVGDKIDYYHTPAPEPKVDRNFKIIFEDESLLVVDKPGDLPMHPSGKFYNNTLWALLKNDHENVHFINRLDRETSGIVLVAKNSKIAATLAGQFEKRTVEKEYHVLVEGEFPESLEAKGYLEKDELSQIRKKQKFIAYEDYTQFGKTGVCSHFELVKTTGRKSLLKVAILTGKMHQIRVTLFSLGYPVVGDKLYGLDEQYFLRFIKKTLTAEDRQNLCMNRQGLHASSLKFRHPVSREEVSFTAPFPDDMAEAYLC